MPKLNFERSVRFSSQQMLALISDIETYPDFVPNCTDMDVRADSDGSLLARMGVQFGPISQAYTSRVLIDEKLGTVTAHAIDGPFSHLDSQWWFSSEGESTKVRFDIDFGFSNPLIAAVAEPAFAAKQDEILDAFMAEAQRRYG